MRRGTYRHTQTDTQTAVTNIHFASATPQAKCNKQVNESLKHSGFYRTTAIKVRNWKQLKPQRQNDCLKLKSPFLYKFTQILNGVLSKILSFY